VNIQLHMLSPLPSSPIYEEFKETLVAPESEDSRYLLLPALLFDERAGLVREVIERAPHLFPGFFCLPTPDKEKKRVRLDEVFTALQATIGRAILDEEVYGLWTNENPAFERQLVIQQLHEPAPARIGTGLALSAFKRSAIRRRRIARRPSSRFAN